jgi:hypothetical protein
MQPDDSSSERTFHKGVHGDYHWLTVTGDVYMGTLLGLRPEAVLNRYLAVTSRDSGVRTLSEGDTATGWDLRGDIAYSPLITSVDSLEFQRDGLEFPGYDEWYVFETPRGIGRVFRGNYFEFQPGRGEILVFVNSPAFVLNDPEPYMPGILDIFWNQLKMIQPETFIADGGECLTLVSKKQGLLDNFQQRLSALA